MSLQSECSWGNAGGHGPIEIVPVRLLNSESKKKDVARLEFHTLGLDGSEIVEVEAGPNPEEIEARLKEEAAALDGRLQFQTEEVARRIEIARSEARLAADEEWQSELDERMTAERQSIRQVCEQFNKERTRYFAGVEAEVVKLALAIATRVLHREVQLDPLLLTGVVRVALEKVAEDSGVMLRVPAEEIQMWQKALDLDPDTSVTLVSDGRLSAGECVLETRVGTVELGIRAQLAEIERGFFDLLQQRPA